jgi:hypothetical protein
MHMKHPKEARLNLGLSIPQLAAMVPCSTTTVYICERTGDYPAPRGGMALRLAYMRALHVSPTEAPAAAGATVATPVDHVGGADCVAVDAGSCNQTAGSVTA